MCWCFRVLFSVFGNLTSRLFTCLTFNCYKIFCEGGAKDSLHQQQQQQQHTNDAVAVISGEEFYKEICRETAETLLQNKQDGTFVIRPSKNSSDLGILSVVQDDRMFHLRIRRRSADNFVALGNEKADEKCFPDINALINYYVSNYLLLYSNSNNINNAPILTLLLPYRDKYNN